LLWGAPRLTIYLGISRKWAAARFFYFGKQMAINEDTLFEKWNEWLSIIHEDIQWICTNYFIYGEIQKIIQKNKNLQENNAIYYWMSMIVVDSVVIGIRRQLCKRKDTISFVKLLEAIKRKSKVISRKRFVSLYTTLPHNFAHGNFDRLAGVGKEYIDVDIINIDLNDLKCKTKDIEKYANNRVAHFGNGDYKYIPTHDEIQSSLDYLKDLLKKYLLIFRAEDWDIIPIFQFDWLKPFREPWIT
jgi:hypothetical protein